jgi:hypothetical protein
MKLGVRVLRTDLNNFTITELTANGGWTKLFQLENTKEVDSHVKKLRASSNRIIFEFD